MGSRPGKDLDILPPRGKQLHAKAVAPPCKAKSGVEREVGGIEKIRTRSTPWGFWHLQIYTYLGSREIEVCGVLNLCLPRSEFFTKRVPAEYCKC